MPLVPLDFAAPDLEALKSHPGLVVVFADAALGQAARGLDRVSRGALARAHASAAFAELKPGQALTLAFPAGLAARALMLVRLPARASAAEARKAGVAIAKALDEHGARIGAQGVKALPDLVEGLALRAYHWSMKAEAKPALGTVTLEVRDPEAARLAAQPMLARAEGVHLARDLTNAPANELTTETFAARLLELASLGVKVAVLDEPELAALGMRALLGVGQGSESPSKVVVMRWQGAEEAPLALIGKGVVFDTGGISIKPAAGMEEMVGDMGGAGVVAGVMHTLARRKARAHVVGIVGLVENMPDGRAQRPGDIVKSMKGDTIEVLNTDAEGRLVLADVMWYAQEEFKPRAMIDLATLTGAIVVALGHENTGLFSNDDALSAAILSACDKTGEGAWRMPLSPAYDKLIDTPRADVKNIGGRWGGAITAAQFLARFVQPGVPWAHLDIAGTALPVAETAFAPKGASGWGVRALDQLIADRFETR